MGGALFEVKGLVGGWATCEALGSDLEAVEEEAGAVDVELVGGEAGDDLVEGGLEGLVVGGGGEVEASASAAGVGVGDGLAVGVVVVAEGFATEGGRAAAVGVGEDVVAVGVGVMCRHGWGPPPGYFWTQGLGRKRLRAGLVEVRR